MRYFRLRIHPSVNSFHLLADLEIEGGLRSSTSVLVAWKIARIGMVCAQSTNTRL